MSERAAAGNWREGLPPESRPSVAIADLPAVYAVQHDSRAVGAGDLFVCIPGERFDGHDFAAAAVAAGAVALVVAHGREGALGALG
ncbi:MAG: hypothetical protein FJZ92_09535, partial [Chloroflexi bacterium]|nr:hypothetical protein [Chloroflexota bacterium]